MYDRLRDVVFSQTKVFLRQVIDAAIGAAVDDADVNADQLRIEAGSNGSRRSARVVLAGLEMTVGDSALAAASAMLPACDKSLTLLPPAPSRACNCGRRARSTTADESDDEMVPVRESARTSAPAPSGSSRRISPEMVWTRSAAGDPRTWTELSPVTIAT